MSTNPNIKVYTSEAILCIGILSHRKIALIDVIFDE